MFILTITSSEAEASTRLYHRKEDAISFMHSDWLELAGDDSTTSCNFDGDPISPAPGASWASRSSLVEWQINEVEAEGTEEDVE